MYRIIIKQHGSIVSRTALAARDRATAEQLARAACRQLVAASYEIVPPTLTLATS